MRIYSMDVVAIGEEAGELLDAGTIITFVSNAPPELASFSVLVDASEFVSPIQAGDVLAIDEATFKILAVGDIANKNLQELAHAVWMFDGKNEVEMPGEIHLVNSDIPPVSIGSKLVITRP
jgi:PTS system glucitol/sorbitol-specific IIA component